MVVIDRLIVGIGRFKVGAGRLVGVGGLILTAKMSDEVKELEPKIGSKGRGAAAPGEAAHDGLWTVGIDVEEGCC